MNFVPPIPQVTQQTYGMNFGDWQQYAGFGKSKPFGGPGMPFDFSAQPVKPPPALSDDTNPTTPVVPYEPKPIANFGQFGVSPNNVYGQKPDLSYGNPEKSMTDLINEHYD